MPYGPLALLPIAIFTVFAVFSKKGMSFAAFAALLSVAATAFFIWGIPALAISAAAIKGAFIALEIGAIVFGALLLFGSFSASGGEKAARSIFGRISDDRVVQAVMIAWAFVHFIEGVSGFGTPAMIAAPLLIALGFGPISAVAMCLIGDSVPVIFGAVGLPVIYGFGSVVGAELADQAGTMIAFANVVSSFVATLALIFVANRDIGGNKASFLKFIPFAAVASLAVSIPALITKIAFGSEMPSIIGGLVGMTVIFFIARRMHPSRKRADECPSLRRDVKPFIPYLLAIAALVITRIPFIKKFLTSFSFPIDDMFGQGIGHTFTPLYAAGVIFTVVALGYIVLGLKGAERKTIVSGSFKRLFRPMVVLTAVLAFVQIFINSGENALGLPSMPEALITPLAGFPRWLWPFIAPFIGAFGSFIAGGATVSNLLLTSLQMEIASVTGSSGPLILALQGLGAAGGNMIAIHNVLAALAVVSAVQGSEKKIMRSNLPFVLIYLSIIGVLGVVASFMIR